MITNLGLDLTVLPKELRLLLSIMKMDNDLEFNPHDRPSPEDIDWARFLEFALHHRVYPLLYTRVKRLKWIPSYVVNSLHREYQRSTFQMLQLSGEMDRICQTFSDNRIRSIVLKGPVLSADLYGELSLRTSRDLDILVPIHDLGQVERLLLGLGYVKVDEYSTILNDWKWRHHHITFTQPASGVTVEIHWRLHPGPAKEPSFHELWDRKRISPLTGSPVYLLGREDLFSFLVSHGARHGWSRLRWLEDIDRMVKQGLDWKALHSLLRKYKGLQLGGQALILASQLLHTPVNEEAKVIMGGSRSRRLAEDAVFYIKEMVNLHSIPVPAHVADYHKRHLFALMSKQQKLLFTISLFYPYPEDAVTLPLPKALHFLYFVLRPFLWAWRKTRKIALP